MALSRQLLVSDDDFGALVERTKSTVTSVSWFSVGPEIQVNTRRRGRSMARYTPLCTMGPDCPCMVIS